MSKYSKLMTGVMKTVKSNSEFKLSGPAKISLKNRCAFSVPAGPDFGCPGATKACDGCYAKKNRHLWSPVQAVMATNWKTLRKFEKNDDIDGAVQAVLKKMRPELKVFRLYESGDFHSQWVIDMWSALVKSRKDVEFWAYTRSFHLNFTPLTRNSNFALWASTDSYNQNEARKFVRRFKKSGTKHAYGPWDHATKIPKNSFVCPVTDSKMEVKGACEACGLCIVKKKTKKNVVFLKH